jgi:WhiB family redox-sensing transcriptional regulator
MVNATRSLIPADALWAWQLKARCRDEDPDIFFPVDGERRTAGLRRQRRAKEICAQCAVVRECLQHSIRHGERFGVWGGLAANERDQLGTSTCGVQ